MNKTVKRLLTFFIWVPGIICIVLLLPQLNHLAANLVLSFQSAVGGMEFAMMLEKKQMRVSKIKGLILGALAPLTLILTINFGLPEWIIPILLMAGFFWAVFPIAFARAENIETAANRVVAGISVLVYPGFFMYWSIKISSLENAGPILLFFLLIPMCNDAGAWLTGSLLGKNNRGIIPASPNKSVAGYIGGIICTMLISAGGVLIIPELFISRFENIPSVVLLAVLGLFTGIASMLGDLVESALKRSCAVKDSGVVMGGRGGALDSIDSIAASAPVFFLLYCAFFINS